MLVRQTKFCPLQCRQCCKGFTSIELLFVLVIAAIMVTLAAPSFRDMLRKQRLTSSVNDFFASVNLTRAEAIGRGRRVDMAPTDGSDWKKGWTVFVDENGNQIPDSTETIIFVHGPLPNDMTVTSNFTAAKPPYLAYNASGGTRSNASAQASRSGSWILTMGGESRKIVINFIGRPRVCNPAVDTGCDS